MNALDALEHSKASLQAVLDRLQAGKPFESTSVNVVAISSAVQSCEQALIANQEPDEPEFDPGQTGPCPGHEWAYTGTQYGGDDESYFGEGRCYCINCGADGDA